MRLPRNDDDLGKLLLGMFLFFAVILATALFFFANRVDDSSVWPQAEKVAKESTPPARPPAPDKQ